MFFSLIKEISRLQSEINRLLTNVFNPVKEINRLKKEIYRLLRKDITQISFNFKTSCCNLKIRRVGAKLCLTFLLF